MDAAALIDYRREKDEFFRTGHNTPLGPGDHSDFDGLDYFDHNCDLVFTVSVDPGDGSEVRVQTSDDREKVYSMYGTVSLPIAGERVTLSVFDTPHGLFIPFRDATSGKTTYGAGRYLDLVANEDGTLTIDFNLAYNPSCVYSDGWSCPIAPVGNWLDVPIEAGEKDYPPPP